MKGFSLPLLRIPEEELPSLIFIRDLPDDSVSHVVAAIEHYLDGLGPVPGVSLDDLEQLVDTLKSLYGVREYADVPLDEFVEDVCAGLREAEELPDSDEVKMRGRLRTLLQIEAVAALAKARLLVLEHERTFCSARIMTDARPIYGTDVSKPPQAFVISHVLKLSYHHGEGDIHDVYIALRSSNLEELRELINRAAAKESSLRAALEATEVRVIQVS